MIALSVVGGLVAVVCLTLTVFVAQKIRVVKKKDVMVPSEELTTQC